MSNTAKAKQGVRCELSNDGSIDVFITGEISDWTYYEISSWNSYDWKRGANARLHIFSGGGSYFSGAAIKDFLESNKISATAYLYGICGSAATIIACGCKAVYAGAMSQYFIHHATGGDGGEVITNANAALVKMYVAKTGLSESDIMTMLDEGDKGAIMSADKALELGFIDGITNGVEITDVTNVIDFATVLNEYKNQNEQTAKATTTTNMNPWEKIKNLFGFGSDTDEVAEGKVIALANAGQNVTAQMLELENKFKTQLDEFKNSMPQTPSLEGYATTEAVTALENKLATANEALVKANASIETLSAKANDLAETLANKAAEAPKGKENTGISTPNLAENTGSKFGFK